MMIPEKHWLGTYVGVSSSVYSIMWLVRFYWVLFVLGDWGVFVWLVWFVSPLFFTSWDFSLSWWNTVKPTLCFKALSQTNNFNKVNQACNKEREGNRKKIHTRPLRSSVLSLLMLASAMEVLLEYRKALSEVELILSFLIKNLWLHIFSFFLTTIITYIITFTFSEFMFWRTEWRH